MMVKAIIFVADGTIHEAHVIEGISEDEVLVRLTDGREVPIAVIRIKGALIDNHPDIGLEVVMLSERDGERNLMGEVLNVYSDVRKIELFSVTLDDGTFKKLDVSRIRYEREDTDFEEGGYLSREDFFKRINELD